MITHPIGGIDLSEHIDRCKNLRWLKMFYPDHTVWCKAEHYPTVKPTPTTEPSLDPSPQKEIVEKYLKEAEESLKGWLNSTQRYFSKSGMVSCDLTKPVIEVFMVGSPVLVGDDIEARVTAIQIKDHNYIMYQCVYWDDNVRRSEWFEQIEVTRNEKSASTRIIGFR